MAIEKYTRISRNRAKTAIEQLIGARLAVQVKQGSHPRYRLLSWQEINESELPTASLASVLEKIKSGAPLSKENVKTARHLVSRGLAVEETFGQFKVTKHEPQLSWLPNAFVCGADGETPPLERLRRYGDAMLLRLAVDLYEHHLEDDGDIAKGVIFGQYDRQLRASVGRYQIFEFQHTNLASFGRGPVAAHLNVEPDGQKDFQPFWERINKLTHAGVIESIPTLFENEGEVAEPIMTLEDQLV